MILDQDQARVKNRYKDLKVRAETHDMTMKHLGKRLNDVDTNTYFENVEYVGDPFKEMLYNIFTMSVDVVGYLAVIAYLWSPGTAFWVTVYGMSGATGVLFWLLINKILEIIQLNRIIKAKKIAKRNSRHLMCF